MDSTLRELFATLELFARQAQSCRDTLALRDAFRILLSDLESVRITAERAAEYRRRQCEDCE